jgi:hypothetical protein
MTPKQFIFTPLNYAAKSSSGSFNWSSRPIIQIIPPKAFIQRRRRHPNHPNHPCRRHSSSAEGAILIILIIPAEGIHPAPKAPS